MKKVFRFQYEPCVGTCYQYKDIFQKELGKISKENLKSIVNKIVEAHDSTCDDPSQRFGVDYDENNQLFVGSFINGTKLDLFSDNSFELLINTLTSHVLKENKNKTYVSGQCTYGNNGNENLAEIILESVS